MSGWVLWLIAAAVFGIGEMLTTSFFLAPFSVGAALAAVTDAAGAGELAAWIVFVVAALSMRAVLGRADSFHYARYGMLAGVPAAWLLMRAWRGSRAGELLFLPALLLILARLHPLATLEFELQALEGPGRLAERAPVVPAPRSGGVRMDAEQAGALTWFRRFVDTRLRPDESFFDFNNSPALYYVTDRRPPIRYCSVAQYESAQRQQEVIAALEKSQPPLAVLPSGPFEKFDGVSNAERAPEVFRYLQENYEPDPEVSWVAWRKGTPGRGPVTP